VNSYKLNGTITLSTTFKVAGVLTDPTTITLVVEAPDGTTSTYIYAGAQITRDSIGAYHKDYGPATQLGVYTYTWTGTGTAAGVEEGQFVVVDLAAPISGARSSMTALVLRVRRLINDPSGGSQVYSDAEIQQVLDTNRQDVRYLELTPDWQPLHRQPRSGSPTTTTRLAATGRPTPSSPTAAGTRSPPTRVIGRWGSGRGTHPSSHPSSSRGRRTTSTRRGG
jgi:hypothetical protein